MDVGAYMKEFEANFSRLKSNREKIPLEQLTTKYAKAYNKLVADIEAYAEWFAGEYIKALAIRRHPKDGAGNAWLQKKVASILEEERKPGGLYQQLRDALIEDLDQEKFRDRVWRIHDRLMREAYDPYQQRFNKWIGKPGNRWIYNYLFGWFWNPDTERYGHPYWMDRDWNFMSDDYPPKIGPDQEGEH